MKLTGLVGFVVCLNLIFGLKVENCIDRLLQYCEGNEEFLTPAVKLGLVQMQANFMDILDIYDGTSANKTYLVSTAKRLNSLVLDTRMRGIAKIRKQIKRIILEILDSNFWRSKGKFNFQKYPLIESVNTFQSWPHYLSQVDNGSPNEFQSEDIFTIQDECIAELFGSMRCKVSERCLSLMLNSRPAYGYHATHRMLYLMIFNHSGCENHLRPPQTVNSNAIRFCSSILNESAFIAAHQFPLKFRDLFMEQVFVCGTFGFTEFLKLTWIRSILSWQAEIGCFKSGWRDKCSRHTTGVGAAVLGLIAKIIVSVDSD